MQELKGAPGFPGMFLAMRNALAKAVAEHAPPGYIQEILDELDTIERFARDPKLRRMAGELGAKHAHLAQPAAPDSPANMTA